MHERYSQICNECNVNIVAYDYSGYGVSTGTPNEANSYADVTAVYEYVCDKVTNNPKRDVILYGQSVGSGPSTWLATSGVEIAGLVLHSAFLSGMRVITESRVLGCLDIYPNIGADSI
jgi:fermentation-respiration switch protein FrsA (DUF1100 family)